MDNSDKIPEIISLVDIKNDLEEKKEAEEELWEEIHGDATVWECYYCNSTEFNLYADDTVFCACCGKEQNLEVFEPDSD